LQTEQISGPTYRGCPFQNTGSEIADADHPAKVVTAQHRQWLRDLFTSLVREAGIQNADLVAGALIVLHDGASASAQVDSNPDAARHAGWAAAQLLNSHA
jgi:hypothetical protein